MKLNNIFKLKSILKLKHISIKWRIFRYLAIFTTGILILLWSFQVVFMNSFYKTIKVNAIKSYANNIAKNINSEDLENLITNYAIESNSSIAILDENNNVLYSSNFLPLHGQIGSISSQDITDAITQSKANSGSYLRWLESSEHQNDVSPINKPDNNDLIAEPKDSHKVLFSILYTKLTTREDGSSVAIVIINANVAPLNETVKTIRLQLVYITIIMLIFALLLALFISKKISKPIIEINTTAKELAKGNYNVKFVESEYKEISELGNTLNYATVELSKNESLRRELIANISHDLRTPLTMITGYAELMIDLPGENTHENIQIIIDEAKRLTLLVNDVLDISKLQSDTQPLKLVEFNLTNSIKDILERYAKFTEQNGYTTRFIYDNDAYVYADELRISQVVYNLVNNALNYTGKDKLVLVKQNCSDSKVIIEIIDTGEGIPQDKLPLVWDRYYKVDKDHKRATIGTGLGLSIVKSILDQHHTKYGVKSTVGQGSIFWFELNIYKSDIAAIKNSPLGDYE